MTEVPSVEPGVLESVRQHAGSAGDRTVGGILIGWNEGDAITVERAVPVETAELHGGELIFDPGTWDSAYAHLEVSRPESKIIGWYHVHPSHGLTLSEYDRSLHRTLFSDPSQVALVVDGPSGDVAWFGWEVERIASLSPEATGHRVEAEGTVAGEAMVLVTRPRPRRRVIGELVAATVVAALIVAAYLWGTSVTGTKVVTRVAPGASSARLQEARAEQGRLQAQLQTEAARAAAVQAQLEATKEKLRRATRLLRSSGAAAKPGTFVLKYQVRPGDSMYQLAQVFYGTGKAWAKIWHANPSPDPNRLLIGSWLEIPLQAAT
jgi:proteasome lid subunit RPN8/RPN11